MLVQILTFLLSFHCLIAAEKSAVDTSTQKAALDIPKLSCEINNPSRAFSKISMLGLAVGSTGLLTQVASLIKYDLEFSDQMVIDLKKTKEVPPENQLKKMAEQGASLCLLLQEGSGSTEKQLNLHVIVKDPATGQEHFSEKFVCSENTKVIDGHRISEKLMLALTGEKGPMLSTLAYCKQLSATHKIVCIADYACKFEKHVVTTKTINVAPAWHPREPGLCYSQFTKTNSRLMYTDLKAKKNKILCSYDGLNMQPSFSDDGSKVVLCLSGKGNSEVYMYDQRVCSQLKKRVYKPLTNNGANNSSPCLLPDGNLIFCSDFQTGSPQIYYRDHKTEFVRRLTNGRGYCAAPAYCAKNNSIVYTRFSHGVFQIYTMDLSQPFPIEHQLTKSHGDKVDPTWSECGRYIAYTFADHNPKTRKTTNQIAILNLMSGKQRVVTSGNEHKSFPSWTGRSLYNL